MEVILLERIEKLGHMGEIVRVKDGYARNFLLPQKKALRATEDNKVQFDVQRESLQRVNDDRRTDAEKNAEQVEGKDFLLIRQAGDTSQLFGSVSARDIANAMSETGTPVKRQQVRLDQPIKTLGLHDVRVVLHPEVIVTVKANVARSIEEAEIQARGGSVEADRDETSAEDTTDFADAESEMFDAAPADETDETDIGVDAADGSADQEETTDNA
ncbi:MAG: 50S ribosomal protein L9 [Alphaproteobacteria bacterium]|jgi:large subunit ribosomal protein L9|nr:50S ribosomal protein L9 [Alphaproteobacteria bacterium]